MLVKVCTFSASGIAKLVKMAVVIDDVVKQISFPLENWRRPPGRPHTTWMKTTQHDLESLNLSLNEAIDVAQNHALWRMISTSGTTHS